MENHAGMNILFAAIGSDIDGGLPGNDQLQLQLTEKPDSNAVAGDRASSQPILSNKRQRRQSSVQAEQVFACDLCYRTYERGDHLSRHLLSHENARSFQCSHCSKRFNRADLLSRHVASHERHSKGPTPQDRRPLIRRMDRASAACVACASSKAKCDDQKPCKRCLNKNIPCQVASTTNIESRQARPNSNESSSSQLHELSPAMEEGRPVGAESSQANILGDDPQPNKDTDHYHSRPSQNDPLILSPRYDVSYVTEMPFAINSGAQQGAMNSSAHSEFVLPFPTDQMLMDSVLGQDITFFPNVAAFNQELDFGFRDFPLNDFELPYTTAGLQSIIATPEASAQTTSNEPGWTKSRGYAAFKRSPWLWTPAQKDHAMSDQSSLALNEEQLPSSLTPGSAAATPGFNLGPNIILDVHSRDRMFAVTLRAYKSEKITPKFPSLEILNHIVQVFFVREKYQVGNWIHFATFSPAESNAQFLNALVSAGSANISVPAIWKMGLALQDVTRVSVAELWESNNTKTRELQLWQAFMLILDVGLWSGFKRHMEISESFAQPLITMLRRTGVFAAPRESASLHPKQDDTGELLDAKWKHWVKRESFKRLAIRLFIHTTQASISYHTSPLVLLPELTFPLPSSKDLWLAKSAEEWKGRFFQKRPISLPSVPRLIDVLHDTTLLDIVHEHIDAEICCTTLLYGYWSQIWSFQESNKFYPENEHQKSAPRKLWLATQQSELYRDILDFGSQLCNSDREPYEIKIVKELFMMLLQVSPDEIQRYAGKGGEEESSRASTVLQNWVQNSGARKAVWHAGQVFHAARFLHPAEIRGFYAIAVYFAALTLWVYSHISGLMTRSGEFASKHQLASKSDQEIDSKVVLDGETSRETRVFLSVGQGEPGLTEHASESETIFASLKDPNVVLKIARQIYRNNYPVLTEPLPPLVENLGNLMRDLSSLPESRFSRGASED